MNSPTAPIKSPGSAPNPAFVSPTPRNLDMTESSPGGGNIPINFENIQGNIFGGFSKDFQTLLFLHFTDADRGRAWLAHIARNIASSDDVIQFNNLFKIMKHRHTQEGIVQATWTNIAFTHSGLVALEAEGADDFPDVYKNGMAANKVKLGDVGESDPSHWVGGAQVKLGSKDVHAVLIVASDVEDEVDPARNPNMPNSTVAGYIQNFGFNGTVKLLYTQRGRTRLDIRDAQGRTVQAGHEHFGFKDGVSQPGIRGVDTPNKDDKDQGNKGQDLLHPGEFVLGYHTQVPEEKEGHDGPNPDPGDLSASGPDWTTDGSYLVFRRLSQNVQGFHDAVKQLAPQLAHQLGLPVGTDATALMGAKLVGRYSSGCPLERLKEPVDPYKPPVTDPGIADPTLANDDNKNNFFEYGYDPLGLNVPRAAHIRKAYPRDQKGTDESGSASESQTQTHRILRRGIPFGSSLGAPQHGEANVSFPNDRGLLFLCYQSDLERQFEFVQDQWINEADFPCPEAQAIRGEDGALLYPNAQGEEPDGEDPIIAQTLSASFGIPTAGNNVWRPTVSHFVKMTGGDYFFAPSIRALYEIAQVDQPE